MMCLGYSRTNQRYQEHEEPNRICKPAKSHKQLQINKNKKTERLRNERN